MKNKSPELKLNGLSVKEILGSGKLIDEVAAAFCLSCSIATLQRDRHINIGNPRIPYIKLGRMVRYEPSIIIELISQHRVGGLMKTDT